MNEKMVELTKNKEKFDLNLRVVFFSIFLKGFLKPIKVKTRKPVKKMLILTIKRALVDTCLVCAALEGITRTYELQS